MWQTRIKGWGSPVGALRLSLRGSGRRSGPTFQRVLAGEMAPMAGKPAEATSGPKEANELIEQGYLVLEGALSHSCCDTLLEHVLATTQEARRCGRGDLFGNIQEAEHRADLKLNLCPPVIEALNSFGERCSHILMEVMGERVRVVELAAITSDPGAVAQPVHADTMHGVTRFLQSDVALPGGDGPEEDAEAAGEDIGEIVRAVATDTALIFTSLLALQDITTEMGPTHVWPQTHTVEHHATLWGTAIGGKLSIAEADKAFGVAHRKMILKKGDLVLYDSRLMHCGGANMSAEHRRSVLCISTMGPGIRPDGTTWTMLPSLRNRLLLRSLPLSASLANSPTNRWGEDVTLPPLPESASSPQDSRSSNAEPARSDSENFKPVPPLEDWEAAVQCTLCSRWRACSAADAPRLTGLEHGFSCPAAGFSCLQEQGYSTEDINAALE